MLLDTCSRGGTECLINAKYFTEIDLLIIVLNRQMICRSTGYVEYWEWLLRLNWVGCCESDSDVEIMAHVWMKYVHFWGNSVYGFVDG